MIRWGVGRVVLVEGVIILAGILMVLALFTESRAEDEATLELPPPATVEETIGPLDMTFYEWAKRRPITNWLKDKLKDMPPFIRDTDLNLQLRTYYFFDEGLDRAYKEAWAGGGWLEYKSGWLCDLFAVSATLYTSQPLYASDGRDGTKLLASGQEGYTVLGQAYGRIKLYERNEFRFFRQSYDSPYINKYRQSHDPQHLRGIYRARGVWRGEDRTRIHIRCRLRSENQGAQQR